MRDSVRLVTALSATAKHCDGRVLCKAFVRRAFGRRSDERVAHFVAERLPDEESSAAQSVSAEHKARQQQGMSVEAMD